MLDFITQNWVEITTAVTAVLVLAEKIAKLTKTEADDHALAWVSNFFNMLALNPKK